MAPSIATTPLSRLRVSSHHVPAHGLIPNCSITRKPLLIYHGAFAPAESARASSVAAAIEAHLSGIGAAIPRWRYTMYSTTHFHSTSHEVLAVAGGRARLCFGGETNPGRVEVVAQRGDVMVLPSGVGHRLLEDFHLSGGGPDGEEAPVEAFLMVGCYPPGCDWDMCYGRKGEEESVKRIEKLPWFEKDPVYGEEGPVLSV